MPFDIAGARNAGYSEDEIARHLAGQSNFDFDGAIKSGYKPAEVLEYLSKAPAPTSAKVADAGSMDPYTGEGAQPAEAPSATAPFFGPGGTTETLGERSKLAMSAFIAGMPNLLEGIKTQMLAKSEGSRPEGWSPAKAKEFAAAQAESALKTSPSYRQRQGVSQGIQQDLAATAPPNESLLGQVAGGVVESAPSMLAGVATGVVSPAAGIAVGVGGGMLQQGQQAYDETGDIGHAIRTSLYEGLGEYVGMRAILAPAKSVTTRIVRAVAENFGEEAAVQLAQGIDARLTQLPDTTIGDILQDKTLWHEALVAGLSGVALAGPAAGVSHLAQRAGEQGRQDALYEAARVETERSLMRQRSPDEVARILLSTPAIIGEDLSGGQWQILRNFGTGTTPEGFAPQGLATGPAIGAEQPSVQMVLPPDAVQAIQANVQPMLTSAQLEAELAAYGQGTALVPDAAKLAQADELHTALAGVQPTQVSVERLAAKFSTSSDFILREWGYNVLNGGFENADAALNSVRDYAMDLLAQGRGRAALALPQGSIIPEVGVTTSNGFAYLGDTPTYSTQKGLSKGTDILLKPGEVAVHAQIPEQVAREAAHIVQGWLKKLAPDARVIIEDVPARIWEEEPGLNGTANIDDQGRFRLEINFAKLLKEGYSRAKVISVLAHEVGHSLGAHLLAKSPKELQNAVLKAWNKDIAASLGLTLNEWYARNRGAAPQMALQSVGGSISTMQELVERHYAERMNDIRNYSLNFDEWMAHNFERILAGDVYRWQKPVRQFMLKAFKQLQELHEMFKVFEPNSTFKKFLDYHIARNAEAVQQQRMAAVLGAVKETLGTAASSAPPEAQASFVQSIDPAAIAKALKKVSNWGMPGERQPDVLERDMDQFSWWKRISFTLLQVAKLNPHIKELYNPQGIMDPATGQVRYGYLDYILQAHKEQMLWASRADERGRQWRKLKTKENEALAQFMYDQRDAGKYFNLKDPLVLKQYGLTPRAIELYERIDTDFKAFLSAIEDARIQEARKRLATNPFVVQEIVQIQKTFEAMRQLPYAPEVRFGRYVVRVVAANDVVIDGHAFKAGDTIERQHAEYKTQQDLLVRKLRKEYGSQVIKTDVLPEGIESLIGMPRQVLDALKSKLQLSDEQQKALDQYIYETAPAQSFVKRLMRRQGVKGFSYDLQRAYMQYFLHGSKHLARIRFFTPLQESVQALHSSANTTDLSDPSVVQDVIKRREIANYAERHLYDFMRPQNDWAKWRGMVALAYLAGNVKTAVMNLTQVAFTTYPELARQYGDVRAIAAIQRGYRDAYKMYHALKPMSKAQEAAINKWVQGKPLTSGEEAYVKQWSSLDAGLRDALIRAQQENVIDQSQAMELAAMSEGNWMSRFHATSELGYYARSAGQALMIPFQLAEQLNRRVTFKAAYELAVEDGADAPTAYQKAVDAVRTTQFEYSKAFRPELLRGKKGIFMMFMQYQLSSLHFATNGYSSNLASWQWRWWAMMLAMGGLLGLPFAENLIDLAEWALLKAMPDKKMNIKYELQKLVGEFTDRLHVSPDVFLHGLSRYGFGALPFADMSGSVSMGRIVPGTDVPLMIAEGVDWNDAVTRTVTEAGGATSTLVMRMLQGMASNDPDTWKRMERAFPMTTAQNLSAAYRWFSRGAEEDARGAAIAEFDASDPWQAAEIAGKALGFQPRKLAETREALAIRRDFAQFYRLRREMLLQAVDEARDHGDEEATSQAIEAIRQYNAHVPVAGLAITSDQLRASVQQRAKARAREEAGYGATKQEEVVRRGVDAGQF